MSSGWHGPASDGPLNPPTGGSAIQPPKGALTEADVCRIVRDDAGRVRAAPRASRQSLPRAEVEADLLAVVHAFLALAGATLR